MNHVASLDVPCHFMATRGKLLLSRAALFDVIHDVKYGVTSCRNQRYEIPGSSNYVCQRVSTRDPLADVLQTLEECDHIVVELEG